MKSSWTKGLNEREAEEVKLDFNASGGLRDRLQVILNHKIAEVSRKGRSEELYSSPNWQYNQADTNGQIRSLEYVLSLIDRN